MAESGSAKFLTGNLFRHITVMSLTSSVGLMAVFIVDFVDVLFISWLGQAELAAAVGYSGAVLFFTVSFGIGMAVAAGAVVSQPLGRGDVALARRRTTNVLIYAGLFGSIFAALVWTNLAALLSLVGAEGQTLDYAVGYLAIIVPGLPFLMMGMVGSAIHRARGDANRAMWPTVWGAIVNAVLDPILIFGLGLDLTGAALASLVSRTVIAIVALRPLLRDDAFDRPSLRGLVVDVAPVFAIAVPAILTQIATPLGRAYVTRAMAEYGEAAVAGLAIIDRTIPVAFGVVFAMQGAMGPIIGQNYGGRRFDRVRTAYHNGLIFIALVAIIVSTLLFLLRGPIADAFNAVGETRLLVFLFCGPLSLLFAFNGVIFTTSAVFSNLGRPFYSTWVNWGRQTVGNVPFVMLFSWWFGAAGVLIGQAVGGVIFALGAVWLVHRVIAAAEGSAPRPAPFRATLRGLPFFHERR